MNNNQLVPTQFTQVPNLVLDQWMPRLTDVELRVLLVVIRQTLGWEEDAKTGRRKEVDWISRSQLMLKTGRSIKHISNAVKSLIEVHHIVEACDEKGRSLETAQKRSHRIGNKVFYRYTWKTPELTLFDKQISRSVGGGTKRPVTKRHATNCPPTKETLPTKESHSPLQPAEPSAHKTFIVFFHGMVQKTRGVKPIITGQDAKNLKRILDHGVEEDTLEQIALYFLGHASFRTFSPSISTLCSAGIVNGLLNRMRNDQNFWKELDHLMTRYLGKTFLTDGNVRAFETSLSALASQFRAPVVVSV